MLITSDFLRKVLIIIPIINNIGNILAAIIPTLILSLNIPDTLPTTVGPIEQPISHAKAKKANIAVPPPLIFEDDILKVPGQSSPTDNPHSPHPIRENACQGDIEIIR